MITNELQMVRTKYYSPSGKLLKRGYNFVCAHVGLICRLDQPEAFKLIQDYRERGIPVKTVGFDMKGDISWIN